MKPERDPVLCCASDCDRPAEVATPAGALCRRHAEDFEAFLSDERRRELDRVNN